MPRPEKVEAVQGISEIFEKATGVFIADFKGLNVEQMGELRNKCREDKVEFLVVKNTLARIAARNTGWDEMEPHLKGPSAIAFSYEDPSAPARVITNFAKEAKKPTIRMSLFEGTFFGPEKVDAIAALPSRIELITQIVCTFNAPIQGLVGSLSGVLRKLVGTLDAVRASKE
ncbi:50S ribosomal protein L10 [candidate division KSB1 bacterium]|nr:50S ribosomal protein L10 [candidate division KSB1 bacterium]